MPTTPITISYGDTEEGRLHLDMALVALRECGAEFEIDIIQLGKDLYKWGDSGGADERGLNSILRNKLFLKAPTNPPENDEHKDVTDYLCEKLGLEKNKVKTAEYCIHANDEITIFEMADSSLNSAIATSIQLLEHLGQSDIAELVQALTGLD